MSHASSQSDPLSVHEPDDARRPPPPPPPPRRGLSFLLREMLLILAIAALLLTIFYPRANTSNKPGGNPNALLRVDEPVRYSYWHQNEGNGSGTGLGQWEEAEGFEISEGSIIVFQPEGGMLIPREHLTRFNWILNPAANNRTGSAPGSH